MSLAFAVAEELYTVEEYLTYERAEDERHEYVDGYVYAMAGESNEHGEICTNIGWAVGGQLRGTICRGRTANSKVRSGSTPLLPHVRKGMFSYPDFFVVCGELEFHDAFKDVVTNPKVIFEVLSPGTENFDRTEKFQRYDEWNDTLSDFILIAQDRPKVEHYTRQSDGSWKYRYYIGLETSFVIESINCQLSLADLYERVKFPPLKPELVVVPKKTRRKKQ